jgi:hypothetical protein
MDGLDEESFIKFIEFHDAYCYCYCTLSLLLAVLLFIIYAAFFSLLFSSQSMYICIAFLMCLFLYYR